MRRITFRLHRNILQVLLLAMFAFLLTSETSAAGVSLTATPTTATVTVGQTATYTIKINRDNYPDKVTLWATGLPTGATATCTPNTTTAASSVLAIKTLPTTPIGIFNITVKGTANGLTIAPLTIKLTTKALPSISISSNPISQTVVAGQPTFYDIAIQRINYDGAVILSAENLPPGITVQFEPQNTMGNSSRMYLYSNGLPFVSNQYSINVRARDLANKFEGLTLIKVVVNCGIVWAQQFGTPNNQTTNYDIATDVTFDTVTVNNIVKDNNVYVVGDTFNTGSDIWVAKFDKFGVRQWIQVLNLSTIEEHAAKVAVDSAGNVYVAGYLQTSTDFVNWDAFLAKLSPTGTVLGSHSVGNNFEDGKNGMSIDIDVSNNVSLTAVTELRGCSSCAKSYSIDRFYFTSNVGPAGSNRLVNNLNGLGDPNDLAIAADGSIYVVGDDINFFGQNVGFAQKFSPNGNSVWREEFAGGVSGQKVALDSTGSPFIALENGNLLKFNSNHQSGTPPLWTTQVAPNRNSQIKALTVDRNDNVFAGGNVNINNLNAWMSKYSGSTGTQMFRGEFIVADTDSFNAIKVGTSGEIYLAGETHNFTNVNFGDKDALVIKYAINSLCLSFP